MSKVTRNTVPYCAATIMFFIIGVQAQSSQNCDCNSPNPYCVAIEISVTLLRAAADRVEQAVALATAAAQEDPANAAVYLQAAAELRASAAALRVLALAESTTCKADPCCQACCKSFYENIENIFNPDAPLINGTLLTMTPSGCNAKSVSLGS